MGHARFIVGNNRINQIKPCLGQGQPFLMMMMNSYTNAGVAHAELL
jgi:hypothetical protein